MAIDTASKRASVLSFNSPWRMPALIPDGALDQADRQHTLWNYAGILAKSVHVSTPVVLTQPGRYGLVYNILFTWARFNLPEWTSEAVGRPIPERAAISMSLVNFVASVVGSSILVNYPKFKINMWGSTLTVWAGLNGQTRVSIPILKTQANVGLWMGMRHIQRLIEDEREIEALIGKL